MFYSFSIGLFEGHFRIDQCCSWWFLGVFSSGFWVTTLLEEPLTATEAILSDTGQHASLQNTLEVLRFDGTLHRFETLWVRCSKVASEYPWASSMYHCGTVFFSFRVYACWWDLAKRQFGLICPKDGFCQSGFLISGVGLSRLPHQPTYVQILTVPIIWYQHILTMAFTALLFGSCSGLFWSLFI